MRETTNYKKLQGTEQLIHAPYKHWKKMSLAETCNQKKGWGLWNIKAPQLWRTVDKLENPPDIWDKLKDGADSVHLSELRYIWKSEPKMTMIQRALRKFMS